MQVREDLGRVVKGQEGIELDFRELETDDLIRVVVQHGDRQWQSDDIRAQEARLPMTRVKAPLGGQGGSYD